MDDSGAILCQVSALKDMVDKVNEEIEANIQITREIESEIVKCGEIEAALAARESELMKLLYLSQFELSGLIAVTVNSRNSVTTLAEEINHERSKRDGLIERLNKKRENFTVSCIQFQRNIGSDENKQLRTLLLEKESLEDEIQNLDQTNINSTNSVSAFLEEILEHLQRSNVALEAEIQRGNTENDQLLKHIDELRTTLLSTVSSVDDPW